MNKILICMIAVLLASCTSTKYVPMESVRTEYRDHGSAVRDTVRETDTRLILIKGDTVRDWRDRTVERKIYVHDTTTVIKTDSVPVPYPVERKLTAWEQTRLQTWGWLLAAAVLLAIWTLRRPLLRLSRRIFHAD